MSSVERRYKLIVDGHVSGDLAQVRTKDRYAFAKLYVFLEELKGSIDDCAKLADEHFADETIENISPFWFLQDRKYNVFRLKLVEIHGWRILTAADHRNREIAILAIMERSQDYQNDPKLIERLKASYEKLGFYRFGH
ncbi:MAG TPA: hypothetical protein VGN68_16190 [Sphingopyxis sp.]|jgi:hypothetical protein|uniref:hypothetical protein n=1 Tax=Sphingopyxis sp. TaxID=1908224 RepID=UPI002E112919|nr:hypothetical protein [Sphingopyxis sp.]